MAGVFGAVEGGGEVVKEEEEEEGGGGKRGGTGAAEGGERFLPLPGEGMGGRGGG